MARILGLDIGDRRIGLALSDETELIASPHSVYQRIGWGPDSLYFLSLAQELNVAYIVAGLPLNMDGSMGPQAQKARDFCAQLEQKGLKVEYIDERLTTKSAEMALIEGGMRRQDRKDTVDKVAAALILQSYLDMKRRPKPQQHQEETDMDENKDLTPEFEEEEEFDNIVELTDEDGVTTAFEYQATIELDGAEYVVLMAPEEDEDD